MKSNEIDELKKEIELLKKRIELLELSEKITQSERNVNLLSTRKN